LKNKNEGASKTWKAKEGHLSGMKNTKICDTRKKAQRALKSLVIKGGKFRKKGFCKSALYIGEGRGKGDYMNIQTSTKRMCGLAKDSGPLGGGKVIRKMENSGV